MALMKKLLSYLKIKLSEPELNLVCWVTAFSALAMVASLAFMFVDPWDDWEHLHASWLVWSGKVPYKDFFEHHNPLLWFMLAPVLGLFYGSAKVIYAARIYMLIISAITWFFIYKICRRFLKEKRIWLFIILFLLTFGHYSFHENAEIRADILMYMFFWSGLYNYFAYLQTRKHENLAWCFTLFVLSFLSLQKILPILFILGLSGLYFLQKGKIRWRDICYALPYPLLILGAFFGYFWYNDGLEQYFLLNFKLNFLVPQYYGLRSYMYGPEASMMDVLVLNNGYFSVDFQLFTTIACSLALLFCVIKPFGDSVYFRLILLLFISELLLRILTFSPWHQYFILLNVLSLIIIGYYICQWLPNYRDALILAVFSFMFISGTRICINNYNHRYMLQREISLRQYVIDNPAENDTVLNCRDYINLYRPDSDYIWFGISDVGWIYRENFDVPPFDLNYHIITKKPKFLCTVPYELLPYTYRFKHLHTFFMDTQFLMNRFDNMNLMKKMNFSEPNLNAYDFDREILEKYYKHTPYNELLMLKKQYW